MKKLVLVMFLFMSTCANAGFGTGFVFGYLLADQGTPRYRIPCENPSQLSQEEEAICKQYEDDMHTASLVLTPFVILLFVFLILGLVANTKARAMMTPEEQARAAEANLY